MVKQIFKFLNKKYPQNFILKNPYIGTLIFLAFCYGFILIYRPLNVHEARSFSLEFTIAIYCCAISITVIGIVKILKHIRYFSNTNEWTIIKEIIAIVIILFGMGITIYFAGFLVEIPTNRWNLSTFLNSFFGGFLIGIVPFAFFTIINYRYLLVPDILQNFKPDTNSSSTEQTEEFIRIGSQLKKEELSFYPSQFIYAKSDGNYVVFYLIVEKKLRKEIIRNSISNIEQQLSAIPFFTRTHRAFIVNVKKVCSQKGNTLGYCLKLTGTDDEIPVSRQKTHDFDRLIKQYL
jgi:hypothetical protein